MAVDAASTAFIFVCMALVQLMTPGLAMFYAGLVRDTSAITMMAQNFIAMGVITILWYLFLYSMCFSSDSWWIFGNPTTYAGYRDVAIHESGPADGIPHILFAAYQGMFAVITPALMTGCFADRFLFLPYIIFISVWMVLVYAPLCHWVWGGGWMAEWGVWDFAGGIVVHISAGFSALATLLVVGKRQVPEGQSPEDLDSPHNVPMVALGTALLWFGWFGFNGGSALGASGVAVAAGVNSEIAGSVACFVWMLLDWVRNKKPGLIGICIGAIAGLATVTPAAGFIQPWGAFIIGVVAAVACYALCIIRTKLRIDDALDVWGVHGMGGFIGTVLLGVLADPSECGESTAPTWCVNPGSVTRSGEQLGKQLAAAIIAAVYSFVITFVFLKLLSFAMKITPTDEQLLDLDDSLHGEHTPTKQYGENTPPKQYTTSNETPTASKDDANMRIVNV